MKPYISALPERFSSINVNKSGNKRSPHKPLLLLIALAKFQQGQRQIPFNSVESDLGDLLSQYGPPTKRVQPELPFWHLQSDGIWAIADAGNLERQASGFPKLGSLRKSVGSFSEDVLGVLSKDPGLIVSLSLQLLNEHFSPTLHEDIIASVGLETGGKNLVNDRADFPLQSRTRDPDFRKNVLRTYEHRCAVTGFRAALNGRFIGCEAAHVRWHAQNGPDVTTNGIALEPTVHKLFDLGAWTLTDDRRVIVSANYTGDDTAVMKLRDYHGRELMDPLITEDRVSVDFIRWHREEELGGVFKGPGLAL